MCMGTCMGMCMCMGMGMGMRMRMRMRMYTVMHCVEETFCPQTAHKLPTNCSQTAQLYKRPMHCMEEALHLHTLAGVARPDLDALFADAPRLHMLAVRPCLCWERRGISATENSPLITEDPRRKSK